MQPARRVAVVLLAPTPDVLAAGPAIDALARRSTTASVDVVHWIECGEATRRLAGATKCHALHRPDRDTQPKQWHERLAAIAGDGFDLVVNLSRHRAGSLIAPRLARSGAEIRGTWCDLAGRLHHPHPALEHLHGWGEDPDLNVFAHRDLHALAARVRVGHDDGLRPDPWAAAIVDHEQGAHPRAPIVCHLSGLKLRGQWAEGPRHRWRDLLKTLQERAGRPVILLGPAAEAEAVHDVADEAGVGACAWPLRFATALLRRCAGLITVDRELAILASAVGTRSVVLRTQAQRGVATLPGNGALLVEGSERATALDVAAMSLQHFKLHELSGMAAAALAKRLVVRETHRDREGFLAARCPHWLPARPEQHRRDAQEAAWRGAWHYSFAGDPIPDELVRRLVRMDSDLQVMRLERARASDTPLGARLRQSAPAHAAA